MAGAPMGAVLRQVSRLFGSGTVAGLDQGQLLDRFIHHKDEAAFAALVERFGPMVLSVCRKLTGDSHAADDAFQATFLVLVRKAKSIRNRELLGNWLYGVAVRVSRKVKADQARRRLREGGESDMDLTATPSGESVYSDHGDTLHEELAKLPEKYRAPLVLCFLDGRTHEQAAEQLGWRIGTVKGRIARAKALLQTRLGRRGVTISAVGIAAVLSESARAAVPPLLLNQTLKAAMALAAGGTIAAGASSASAFVLSREVVTSMTLTKIKLATMVCISLGSVAAGAGVFAQQRGGADIPDAKPDAGGPQNPDDIKIPPRPIGDLKVRTRVSESPLDLIRVTAKSGPVEETERESDDPENDRKILEILSVPMSMAFSNETPLEDVITYIRQATDKAYPPSGIPIYVDPIGLQEAEKTMASPIVLNLDGVKLKTTLRLILDQLALGYYVKDGMLVITSPHSDNFPVSAMSPRQKADRAAEREERDARRKQQLKQIEEGKGEMGGGGFQ